jgi:hypothetical protein
MSEIGSEFQRLIEAAQRVSADVGDFVGEILQAGVDAPLSEEEARALLARVVETMRANAATRDDRTTAAETADVEAFLVKVEACRLALPGPRGGPTRRRVTLQTHNGVEPRAVRPTPVFHERSIPVWEGFVRTKDIKLWGENQRIDIHLNQFAQAHGRRPDSDELLSIMLGEMSLPGLTEVDQFEIQDLARSVAANGVRKPPIIDPEGNLLDGNRRVSACYYILNSPDFDAEQKKRAEWIQVWQLTEHATDDDREAVIVSLNFEPDYKQDWPKYVKARKVYEYWQSLLALEGRANPSPKRQSEIRKQIARKFAIDMSRVLKDISMIELASEFEEYHVFEGQKDKFEVKHKAEKYFEYFDELGKGAKNGVLASLNEDEAFKATVYELLYDGKFKNWNQVRELRNVSQNDEALIYFREARDEKDTKQAQKLVESGIALARTAREIERTVGANKRVEVFTAWLENAPVKIFRPGPPEALTKANLHRLYRALKLVEGYVEAEEPTETTAGPHAHVA